MRLMIVDDERFPLECLANDIPWSNYGIEVVATKNNGQEALKAIPEVYPELVITDVRMPIMDGIELLKRIKNEYPYVNVIIMSGYEEFSYVKDAINLGAKNYILKPIDPNELLDAVIKIRDEINKMHSIGSPESTYSDFLRNQMYGCFTPEEGNKAIEKFGASTKNFYRVVSVVFDDAISFLSGGEQSAYTIFAQKLNDFCSSTRGCYITEDNPHLAILVLETDKESKMEKLTSSLCISIKITLQNVSIENYAVGISSSMRNLENLSNAYLQAMSAVSMRYLSGNGRAYVYGEKMRLYKTDEYLSEKAQELVESVLNYSEPLISDIINDIAMNMVELKYLIMDIQNFARIVIAELIEKLGENEIQLEEIYPSPKNIIIAICSCQGRHETLKYLQVFLKTIASNMSSTERITTDNHIAYIKKYIEDNYSDSQLSSSVIAQKMHFNSAYVSALFSSSCGMTITAYINTVRIHNAVRLLDETDEKISMIAKMVGYESRSYFSTVFRNITGKTPSDYRTN